jgi:hypothetical protein
MSSPMTVPTPVLKNSQTETLLSFAEPDNEGEYAMRKIVTLAGAAAVGVAMSLTAAADQPDRRTDIRHPDGSTTTVTTDRSGTLAVTPGHGGSQAGRGVPHDDVVKEYTRPGSQVERR